jgi:hypothetical protein
MILFLNSNHIIKSFKSICTRLTAGTSTCPRETFLFIKEGEEEEDSLNKPNQNFYLTTFIILSNFCYFLFENRFCENTP